MSRSAAQPVELAHRHAPPPVVDNAPPTRSKEGGQWLRRR
jgi:hypothetical protein